MITAYQVSYENYTFPNIYLYEKTAINHVAILEEMKADNPRYNIIEIDSMTNQRILLKGSVVGYQFSRTVMGKRTVKRKVNNIEETDNGLIGTVNWKDRILRVKKENSLLDWEAVTQIRDENA